MISVCIPVYNMDVRALVSRLHEMGTKSEMVFEILVIDDASSDKDKAGKNAAIVTADNIRYKTLPGNIGRNLIRFELANHALFDYLLFIDADSSFKDTLFFSRYLQADWKNHLIVGGRSYMEKRPNRDQLLHWKYGRHREQRSAAVRSFYPYRSFLGCNFMISKQQFLKLLIDRNLQGYCHEDTFMGMQFEKMRIPVKHIDNPVIHTGLDSTTEFLRKQEEALYHLSYIHKTYGNSLPVVKQVRLLQTFESLNRKGALKIYKRSFLLLRKVISKNLFSSNPFLFLLDAHKLGVFIEKYSGD